jgi:hypothetical protein
LDISSYNNFTACMRIKYFILLFVIALAGLTSCKNNDNFFIPLVPTDITVVNASADTLNFYLNGTRQNNSSSIFPAGSVTHLTVPAGAQNYQFKKAGSSTILFSVPLTLTQKTFNSLYLTGETADKAFNTVDTLLADSILARVRFVHTAPDAGSLDVLVGDTVNFKSRAFKSSSVFLKVGSGQKRVRIFMTGSATAKVDTTITMQPGRIYTLFAKGLLNGKGNSVFDVGIILNL